MNHTKSLEEVQYEIERFSNQEAARKTKNQNEKHIKNGQEYNLSYGQDLMRELLPIPEEHVDNLYIKAPSKKVFFHKVIKPQHEKHLAEKKMQMPEWKKAWEPKHIIADIISVTLVCGLSKEPTLNNIIAGIANNLVRQFNLPIEEREYWRDEAVKFVTPIVFEIAGRSDIYTVEQEHNREYRFALSDKWKSKVEQIQSTFGLCVNNYKPMVTRPGHHTNILSAEGGFMETPSPILKHPVRIDGEVVPELVNFTAESNPEWFEAFNKAQDTAYCVEKGFLELIEDFHLQDMNFSKFPTEVDNEAWARDAQLAVDKRESKRMSWAAKNNEEYKPLLDSTTRGMFNNFQSGAVEQVRKTNALIEQAQFYSKFNEIFFALFADYRGRRYPYANTNLSFQGDEMAKALLSFANKKVITTKGKRVMFETLGNCIKKLAKKNNGVKAANARKWFEAYLPDFMAGDFSVFIKMEKEFDEPVNAMRVCYELTRVAKDPAYKSGYIAHRDARCSGASIMGTILNDLQLMKMTSVVEHFDEDGNTGDAYRMCAEQALAMCNERAEAGCKLCQGLLEVADDLFTRGNFKFVVMVMAGYGGTEYGLRKNNTSELKKQDDSAFIWEEEELTLKHKAAFDKLMSDVIAVSLPACRRYLDKSSEVSKIVVERDGFISFSNPINGFPVVNREFKTDTREVNATANGKRIRISLFTRLDTLDNAGMRNAFTPNLVHTMDAALLNLVEGQLDCDLSLIHDSFGAHPEDVDFVLEAYTSAMNIYAQNNLFQMVFDELETGVEIPVIGTYTGEKLEPSSHILV